MNRRDILKSAGAAGIASLIPFGKNNAAAQVPTAKKNASGNCSLIPGETAGPYPLDLSGNQTYFRQDITEAQAGVRLDVRLKILGDDNCLPMQNCRVDIWHCNALGYYSGYTTTGQSGSINYASERWLRGIQMTDSNGEVTFTTIFPGWYNGRIIHIHFQVYLSSVLQVTSQLTFPVAEKDALLAAHAPYSTYGSDPTALNSDNVFSDGYALQMATLTPNGTTGGYDTYLEVTINGTGTTGLQKLEPETGGQFKLGQNFPNPYGDETTIPFVLKNTSDVKLELFDLMGRKVAAIINKGMNAGEQQIKVDLKALGLAHASYVYQLEVENSNGVFRQCKMMTVLK